MFLKNGSKNAKSLNYLWVDLMLSPAFEYRPPQNYAYLNAAPSSVFGILDDWVYGCCCRLQLQSCKFGKTKSLCATSLRATHA
jgi:hypothetical protein